MRPNQAADYEFKPAAARGLVLGPLIFTTGPGVAWLSIFLIVPLLLVFAVAFLSRGDYGQLQLPLTLENFKRLAGFGELGFDLLYPLILVRTVVLAALTTLCCLLAAVPLAFFISMLRTGVQSAALVLIVIPFWTNLLIRTYAWQILLSPESWLTKTVHALGIGVSGQPVYPGFGAVLLGMICDFLPFAALPLYASVEKIDWTLAEAAADLGARPVQVFRHALLPQIAPGLKAGAFLTFLPALGQFLIPDLLGGAKTVMLGNAIQQQFGQGRDWPFGSAIALTALVLVLVAIWRFARDEEDVMRRGKEAT